MPASRTAQSCCTMASSRAGAGQAASSRQPALMVLIACAVACCNRSSAARCSAVSCKVFSRRSAGHLSSAFSLLGAGVGARRRGRAGGGDLARLGARRARDGGGDQIKAAPADGLAVFRGPESESQNVLIGARPGRGPDPAELLVTALLGTALLGLRRRLRPHGGRRMFARGRMMMAVARVMAEAAEQLAKRPGDRAEHAAGR